MVNIVLRIFVILVWICSFGDAFLHISSNTQIFEDYGSVLNIEVFQNIRISDGNYKDYTCFFFIRRIICYNEYPQDPLNYDPQSDRYWKQTLIFDNDIYVLSCNSGIYSLDIRSSKGSISMSVTRSVDSHSDIFTVFQPFTDSAMSYCKPYSKDGVAKSDIVVRTVVHKQGPDTVTTTTIASLIGTSVNPPIGSISDCKTPPSASVLANDIVYFGGDDGILYYFNTKEDDYEVSTISVGAGRVWTLIKGENSNGDFNNKLYIGTSFGFVSEYDTLTKKVTRIAFFYPGSSLLAIGVMKYYREKDEILLVGSTIEESSIATETWLGRLSISSFSFVENYPYKSDTGGPKNTSNVVLGAYINKNLNQFTIADFLGVVTTYKIVDCTNPCSQCGGEYNKQYCGWCGISSSCTLPSDCSDSNFFSPVSSTINCPEIIKVYPKSVFNAAIREITIVSTIFYDIPTGYKCKFGQSSDYITNATYVNYTQLTCMTPSIWNGDTGVNINLTITLNDKEFLVYPSFQFFKCADQHDCPSCNSILSPYCVWCHNSSKCVANISSQCSDSETIYSNYINSCPAVKSIDPSHLPVMGNKDISLTLTIPVNTDVQCTFHGSLNNITVNANVINQTTITCKAPPNPEAEDGIVVTVTSNNADFGSIKLIYYDCNSTSNNLCTICLRPYHLECEYCPGNRTHSCIYKNLDTCSFKGCPNITSVYPLQLPLNIPETVYVYGGFPAEDPVSLLPLRCYWDGVVEPTNATFVDTTTILCDSPLNIVAGNYTFSIYSAEAEWAASAVAIDFINCKIFEDCFSCLGFPFCIWQNDLMNCDFGESFGYQSCPNITSISPRYQIPNGNISIHIDTTITQQKNWTCVFGGNIYKEAILVNSTVFVCPIPDENEVSNVKLNVSLSFETSQNKYFRLVNNMDIINIFYCKNATECNTCTSGLYTTACTWCTVPQLGCTSSYLCLPDNSVYSCPFVSSISPNITSQYGSQNIYIYGNNFPVPSNNSKYNVTLQYGTSYNPLYYEAIRINSSTLSFNLYTSFSYVYWGDDYNKTISFTISLSLEGQPIYGNSVLQVFTCTRGFGSLCDVDCLSIPYCGWCFTKKGCMTSDECVDSSEELWIAPDSTRGPSSCPNIVISPDNVQANTDQTYITVNISNLFFSQKRSIDFQNSNSYFLECQFINKNVQPFLQSLSNLTLSDDDWHCQVPYVTLDGTLSTWKLQVLVNKIPLTPSININFVDCTGLSDDCSACTELSYCGWCFQENICSTYGDCIQSNPSNEWKTSCPHLYTISPRFGSSKGGDIIVLTGINFIPGLTVTFTDDNPSNASNIMTETLNIISINSTTIVAVTPLSSLKTVIVQILLNQKLYTTETLYFDYIQPLSNINQQSVSPADITGIIIGCVLGFIALILLIAGILYRELKNKQDVFKVKLVEPDYYTLLWGTYLESKIIIPKDEYHELEQAILKDNLSFIIGTSLTITEYDKFSKAAMILAQANNTALTLLYNFIEYEVQNTETANTIFRQNSLASKCFTTYARMVATEYLFDVLAPFVQSLDHITTQSAASENLGILVDVSVGVEVDPEKLGEEMDVDANAMQLEVYCQKILRTIIKSQDNIPMQLRAIFSKLNSTINIMYPDDVNVVWNAIGGFFFLRFIGPGLFSPQIYGLLPHTPHPNSQRQFILIAKVIQNLANLQVPGNKEKFMAVMTPFIEKNIPVVKQFYDSLKDQYIFDTNEALVNVPDKVRLVCLSEIYSLLYGNREKISAILKNREDLNPQEIEMYQDRISTLIDLYGIPKKEKKKSKSYNK